MVIVLVVIAVLFHLLTNGLIFTAMNLTNIILQNSYVVLLILGMLPVILTGNVDLSVGSVLAFVGAIAAILQVNYHCGVLVTLLVSLLVGILIGCWQGMWIAYFDIPAFLVTLSGELVFRGLTQVVLDGASIGPFSDTFRAIASSFIPDLFGGSGFHLTTMILAVLACAVYVYLQLHGRADKQRHGVPVRPITGFIIKCVVMCAVILYLSWQMASYNGYPTVLIIMLVLCLVYSFICSRTIFGRGLYAIGVDSDQKYINPDVILCSMIKQVNLSIEQAVTAYATEGTWMGGQLWVADMATGLIDVGYGDDTMTQQVSDELKAEVEEIKAQIIAGEIEVPTAFVG